MFLSFHFLGSFYIIVIRKLYAKYIHVSSRRTKAHLKLFLCGGGRPNEVITHYCRPGNNGPLLGVSDCGFPSNLELRHLRSRSELRAVARCPGRCQTVIILRYYGGGVRSDSTVHRPVPSLAPLHYSIPASGRYVFHHSTRHSY